MSLAQTLRDAITGLGDLLVPFRCAGCGIGGAGWCTRCSAELGGLRLVQRPLLAEDPPAYALGRYRSAARKAVLAYKESGRRDLAEPFGQVIATALRSIGDGPWCVIPAPSRRSASRRRGGAHMLRVGHRVVAALTTAGVTASLADCLRMRPGARDSVGLSEQERVANLAGRLRVSPAVAAGIPAVLIDDVITTGATAAVCVDSLKQAGITPHAVIALTATAG